MSSKNDEKPQLLIDSAGETLNPVINEQVKKKLAQVKKPPKEETSEKR